MKRSSRDSRLHGHFLLSLGDNMAEVLAFERGRAVNWELNSLCRVAASRQLGCQIVWRRRHVESERNPSDADSRLADRGLLFPGEVLRPGQLSRRLGQLQVSPASRPGPKPSATVFSRGRSDRPTPLPAAGCEGSTSSPPRTASSEDSERDAQGASTGKERARTPAALPCPPVRKLETRLPRGVVSVWSCSRAVGG